MTQPAFPGPAVAISPTGFQLAEGPPGDKGEQGDAGPPGPPGAANVATQYITSSTSNQIVMSGATQPVDVDATGGTVTLLTPAFSGVQDGACFELKDNTASWGGHQVGLQPETGISVEDPQNPGTYVVGPSVLSLPKVNGAGGAWRCVGTRNKWGLRGGG